VWTDAGKYGYAIWVPHTAHLLTMYLEASASATALAATASVSCWLVSGLNLALRSAGGAA